MKKFLKALLLASVGIGLYSCNNGAYHAQPDNTSGVFNPLNPTSPVKVPLGTIRVEINNITYDYYPAMYKGYAIPPSKTEILYFQAKLKDDVLFKRAFQFVVYDYKNTKEYALGFAYMTTDTTSDTLAVYGPTTDFKFEIKGDEGGNFRGEFSGPLKLQPAGGTRYNLPEIVTITKGEYYIPRNPNFKILTLETPY